MGAPYGGAIMARRRRSLAQARGAPSGQKGPWITAGSRTNLVRVGLAAPCNDFLRCN
jgi:hypothetical protein